MIFRFLLSENTEAAHKSYLILKLLTSSPFECATESFGLKGEWHGTIRNDFTLLNRMRILF